MVKVRIVGAARAELSRSTISMTNSHARGVAGLTLRGQIMTLANSASRFRPRLRLRLRLRPAR
jgi:hypothetical protein